MDNSPLPNFAGSAFPGRDELPIALRLGQPSPLRVSDPLGLIDVLRQALDERTRPTESILRAATDAARVLTGAHGTALALRTSGVILCRARSGDIAPALGAPLNVESGISGECLRRATILVCNDAASDPRVDREACLSLGVRSIVVVPLRGGMGVAGLMEAFSTRAYAFGTEQIDTLRALAQIAEAAYDREGSPEDPEADSTTPADRGPALFASPVVASPSVASPVIATTGITSQGITSRGFEQTRATKFSDDYEPKRRYWIPAVAVIALLLVSMVAWWSWRDSATEIAASETPASSANAPEASSGPTAPRVLPMKPSPGVASHQSERSRTKDVLRNAAEIDPEMVGPGTANSGPESATENCRNRIPRRTPSRSACREYRPVNRRLPSR